MKNMYDCYTLKNGLQIPCLGFGTYCREKGYSEMIRKAIGAGYRYFDTASLYLSEIPLGLAIKESGIPREEFFIETKMWHDEMGYEETKAACRRSLDRLQMDYLDLYLIHWPKHDEQDPNWKETLKETWKAMEELVDEGLVRGIGVSNFLPHHLEVIMKDARYMPLVNQLELHPGYTQELAVSYCQQNDIRVLAWSPLGRSELFKERPIQMVSEKYGKSPAQICLRFLLQKGIVPLPKSASEQRMLQNQDFFDFEIEQEDMYLLSCMPQTCWKGEHPDFAIPKKDCPRAQ